jgi:hypothetical protein
VVFNVGRRHSRTDKCMCCYQHAMDQNKSRSAGSQRPWKLAPPSYPHTHKANLANTKETAALVKKKAPAGFSAQYHSHVMYVPFVPERIRRELFARKQWIEITHGESWLKKPPCPIRFVATCGAPDRANECQDRMNECRARAVVPDPSCHATWSPRNANILRTVYIKTGATARDVSGC